MRRSLDKLLDCVNSTKLWKMLFKKENQMSQETDELKASVTAISGTVQSAIALISGITARIEAAVAAALSAANADAASVAAAVREATAEINADNQGLADAVAA